MEDCLLFDLQKLHGQCRYYYFKRRFIPVFLIIIIGGVVWSVWKKHAPLVQKRQLISTQEKNVTVHPKKQEHEKNVSLQTVTMPVRKQTPPPSQTLPTVTSQPQKRAKASECYSLQLFYVYERYIDNLRAYQKKVARYGFSCFIQPGQLLANGKRRYYLRCGKQEHIKDLAPLVQKAKKHH